MTNANRITATLVTRAAIVVSAEAADVAAGGRRSGSDADRESHAGRPPPSR